MRKNQVPTDDLGKSAIAAPMTFRHSAAIREHGVGIAFGKALNMPNKAAEKVAPPNGDNYIRRLSRAAAKRQLKRAAERRSKPRLSDIDKATAPDSPLSQKRAS